MELRALHLTEDEVYVVQSAKSVWLKTEKGFMKTICGPHTATYNVKDCFYGNIEDSAVLMDCYEKLADIPANNPLENDEHKRAFDILWAFI